MLIRPSVEAPQEANKSFPIGKRHRKLLSGASKCISTESMKSMERNNTKHETNEEWKKKEKPKIKCTECDFTSSSEQGLIIHQRKKHRSQESKEAKKDYPQPCELCDKMIETKIKMRNHMKTHSYKYLEFQCAECDFSGETEYTMEVHLEKTHSDLFECGICDFEAKDTSMLEMHLFSCQIYVVEIMYL